MSSLLLLKPDYFLNLEFSELLPSRPPPSVYVCCLESCISRLLPSRPPPSSSVYVFRLSYCHATDVFDPVLYTNATLIIVETRLILEL